MSQTIEIEAAKHETLHISLLGKFNLRIGKTAILLNTPRYQSLLAFLMLHPEQTHPRSQLAFQFWPNSRESQARTNLRKARRYEKRSGKHAYLTCFVVEVQANLGD